MQSAEAGDEERVRLVLAWALDVVAVLGHEHARLDVGEHVGRALTPRQAHPVCLVCDGRRDRSRHLTGTSKRYRRWDEMRWDEQRVGLLWILFGQTRIVLWMTTDFCTVQLEPGFLSRTESEPLILLPNRTQTIKSGPFPNLNRTRTLESRIVPVPKRTRT